MPLPPKPPTEPAPKGGARRAARPKAAPKAAPPTPDGTPPEFPRTTPEEAAEFATGFGGQPRRPVPSAAAPSTRKLQTKLEELFGSLALPFALTGDTHCAGIIAQRTPAMAEAWADLADQNPGVKRVLTRLTEGSAWGGVILSTAAVALPIAQHHGLGFKSDPFSMIFATGATPAVPPRKGASDGGRRGDAPAAGASVAGAPAPSDRQTAAKFPAGRPSDPNFTPSGAPEGVVLVGHRNRANGGNPHAA